MYRLNTETSGFLNVMFPSYLEFWTMEKGHNPSKFCDQNLMFWKDHLSLTLTELKVKLFYSMVPRRTTLTHYFPILYIMLRHIFTVFTLCLVCFLRFSDVVHFFSFKNKSFLHCVICVSAKIVSPTFMQMNSGLQNLLETISIQLSVFLGTIIHDNEHETLTLNICLTILSFIF
jgi:hypothetical protein